VPPENDPRDVKPRLTLDIKPRVTNVDIKPKVSNLKVQTTKGTLDTWDSPDTSNINLSDPMQIERHNIQGNNLEIMKPPTNHIESNATSSSVIVNSNGTNYSNDIINAHNLLIKYQCPYCERHFKVPSGLLKHLHTHKGKIYSSNVNMIMCGIYKFLHVTFQCVFIIQINLWFW